MQITPVSDHKQSQKDFLDVARRIYQDDEYWICPLDQDIEAIFDPAKNPFFKHGKCIRWILKNDKGELIGRVAAFINEKKAYQYEQPTGGMGFFECINDQKAAFLLFDTAQNWLRENGMQAMDGPINFGENDSFWGLLVDGFTQPSYGMNYHLPYYHELFTAYGFEKSYEQITNHLAVRNPFPERFTKIANWVANKPGYTFEHFSKSNAEKYVRDLMEIYNDAWINFENFVPIKKETLEESFKKMQTIMDEKLIWFAYLNGEPASFVVIIPDANQMIKGFNGKLGLLQKLKFVYRRWKGVNRMRAIVMGTKTAYQKHGLESALFIKLKEYVLPLNQYDELELSWVGDFNDKMLAIHQATGATFGKRHLTMHKKF
ncbi:GNAT family N-acetyltransferase [Pedobacter sp. MC2016-24]|uniref:GNAT family N-acetyltransferase n=1 Tax=Pedobacter sp. MC2016-24 TaxID=2780090 RepID=UPI00187EA08E|nr:GNAT family N-acetyltransferase [Pedobacter sp. MC2016-24]MBE9600075.1 GNAT family N-acetyltransferase [Pedobacter sp. MC2016-24]